MNMILVNDSNSPHVVISTPVHTDVEASVRQLQNYNSLFGGNFTNVLHLSLEASYLREEYQEVISSYPNVHLVPSSMPTSIYCTLGAHIAVTDYIVASGIQPEYIYFHSGTDLLVKRGLADHISRSGSGIMHYKHNSGSSWAWRDRLEGDKSLSTCLKELDIAKDEVYFGRIEGAYMRFEYWLQAHFVLKRAYDFDSFIHDSQRVWPAEECIVPTYYINKHGIPKSNIAVITKRVNGVESRNNYVTLEDIQNFLLVPDIYGAKWFSSHPNDPAIVYLKSIEES